MPALPGTATISGGIIFLTMMTFGRKRRTTSNANEEDKFVRDNDDDDDDNCGAGARYVLDLGTLPLLR